MEKGRRLTLIAFAGFVVIAGLNFVAVRFSNRELAPFWGAGLRFGAAGLIFLVVALARRSPFPRGRALAGAVVFGTLAFGVSYALAYYALVRAPASVAAVIVALAPLMTLFLASVVHGVERLRARGIIGGVVALLGIALIFRDGLVTAQVPMLSLMAIALMTLCLSEATVLVKRFPKVDPFAMNATGMLVGSTLLLALSFAVGERWALPHTTEARLAVLYLILVGSVVMFFLYLFVLGRWSASATSYQAVLSPVVTILAGAILAGESVGWVLVAGGALVLAGVYFGALRPAPTPPR